MAAYESVQSNTTDNLGTVVITKPVGLAVGDKLLAGILVDADGGGTQLASIATPAGWTQDFLLNLGAGASTLGVFSKTADAADVAASTFTFTGTGDTASMTMAGHLVRVSNWGGYAGTTTGIDATGSSTLTMTGITPSPVEASSLYVVFAGRVHTTIQTVTSVAIATSNPTWTERAEVGGNGNTRETQFAVYTATRLETTATGNYTVTYASVNNTRSGAVGLILHSPINGSVNPATEVNAYALSPIPKTDIDAIVDTPTTTVRTYTNWVNEPLTNTEWQNEI